MSNQFYSVSLFCSTFFSRTLYPCSIYFRLVYSYKLFIVLPLNLTTISSFFILWAIYVLVFFIADVSSQISYIISLQCWLSDIAISFTLIIFFLSYCPRQFLFFSWASYLLVKKLCCYSSSFNHSSVYFKC